MAVTAGYIKRTELSLSDLSIIASPFSIAAADLNPGAVVWRRQMATSPFVAGAQEVNAVKDVAKGQFGVYVAGANAAAIATNVQTLIAAVSQSTFEFHLTLDGTDWAWTCYRADYGVVFDWPLASNKQALIKCQFPRKPIQVAGPF